jgi:hypothetical protein
METIYSPKYHDAINKLAADLAADRPTAGKLVQVAEGKHKDFTGRVFWHGPNKYASTRNATDAQLLIRDIAGRRGYRVGVRDEHGTQVFVDADLVNVLDQGE